MLYQLTDEAIDDLDEIYDFISRRRQNQHGAETVEAYLIEAFERIGLAPKRCGGKAWPDLTALPVKFLTVRRYVIIYDDRFMPVRIIAIIGGSRDFKRLLSDDPRFVDTDEDN